MKLRSRLRSRAALLASAATATFAGFAFLAPAAGAAPLHSGPSASGASRAVFVQTDNLAGNQVVAYSRADNGGLTLAATYDTGGLGGQLVGSMVDHLASQGSLAYVPKSSLLVAVNAGSDTISVFGVRGDQLTLRQVTPSGGQFPVSVAVHGDLVYVLNALNGGDVAGFSVRHGRLVHLPGSVRALGLDPTASPQFTNTPGQAAFTPDGSQLIVTTKDNGNDIDVFRVGRFGYLSASPVANSEPGTVPFGVTFDRFGHLLVADAGNNAVSSFSVGGHGGLTSLDTALTGQSATCWIAPARGHFYASNAGSANVTGYDSSLSGQLTSLGNTSTDPGTVDASASAGGRYLYVQTGGNGIVDGFRVHHDGSLTPVGSVTVPGAAGGEGIVAF
jgi:6-phosphogluconolactonase (cycloisomerase 2 family)